MSSKTFFYLKSYLFLVSVFWVYVMKVLFLEEKVQIASKLQKQPCADVLQNRCSEKIRKFSKTPVLESLVNRIAGLQARSFVKKRLQHRCFLVKIAKYLRATNFLGLLFFAFLLSDYLMCLFFKLLYLFYQHFYLLCFFNVDLVFMTFNKGSSPIFCF